jgi:hypothetical protein
MRLLSIVVGLLGLALVFGVWCLYHAYSDGSLPIVYNEFQRNCHEAIKKRLQAPSTFIVIESFETSREATFDDVRESYLTDANGDNHDNVYIEKWRKLKEQWSLIEAGNMPRPLFFDVMVRFDSMNIYGAPIRQVDVCSVLDEFGRKPSRAPSPEIMLVGGKTYYQWALTAQ